jgi:hypothetical protein
MIKFLFFVILLRLSSTVYADEQIDKLTKRIELLEKQQSELLLQSTPDGPFVNSFLQDGLTIGGFFETSYTGITGPDTRFQATNSSNLLGLNFAATFSNNLRFVSQVLTGLTIPLQNRNNDSRANPIKREFGGVNFGAVVTQGYIDYNFTDKTNLQAGFGYVPFGYAAQQREIVLFIRRGGPQILRTTELISPLWSGLNFSQHFNTDQYSWGYNLYSFTRLEDPKMPGVGGRTWWNSSNDKISAGLSVQAAEYHSDLEESLGTDLRLHFSNFVVSSEYVRHLSQSHDDPWSAYIEPGLLLFQEEVLLYTFLDYSENPMNKTAQSIDSYHKYEYGAGINWLPTSYTRLRLGLTYNDYVHEDRVTQLQNRDYTNVDVSVGVAF